MGSETVKGIPEFICVRIDDPDEPGKSLDAIVRTSQIVKIARRKFEVRRSGDLESRERFYGKAVPDLSTLDSDYIITDSAGCQYMSRDCSPQTQDVISSLWASYFQE
jgi:hypothetical protein